MKVTISNWMLLKKYFKDIPYTKTSLLDAISRSSLEKEGIISVDIIFVSTKEIQKLNREFRKQDIPTDVLSFNIEEKSGEIYICPSFVAKQYDSVEILRLIVHGGLHLAGYDHKGKFTEKDSHLESMFVKQENILQNILNEINSRVR